MRRRKTACGAEVTLRSLASSSAKPAPNSMANKGMNFVFTKTTMRANSA